MANDRRCIFCGSKPQNKTREHIIPQWLIEMTGVPNRIVSFGSSFGGNSKNREFSYDKFRFPACKQCNNDFSILEQAAKKITNKLLNTGKLNRLEILTFMDWLDKIRVGLWLAFTMLDNNPFNIIPNYHIAKRIGYHDRMFAVYRSRCTAKRTFSIGVDSMWFRFMPSCFAIAINDLYIFNVSKDYYFAKKLGFPYPVNVEIQVNETMEKFEACDLFLPGADLVEYPLMNLNLQPSSAIYQPIFFESVKAIPSLYQSDFITQNSIDVVNGKGGVLLDGLGFINHDEDIDIVNNIPIYNDWELWIKMTMQVYETQTELGKSLLSFNKDEENSSLLYKQCDQYNDALLAFLNEQKKELSISGRCIAESTFGILSLDEETHLKVAKNIKSTDLNKLTMILSEDSVIVLTPGTKVWVCEPNAYPHKYEVLSGSSIGKKGYLCTIAMTNKSM